MLAVNDATVRRAGRSRRLGRYLVLEDDDGNRYSYSRLAPAGTRGGPGRAAPNELAAPMAVIRAVARVLEPVFPQLGDALSPPFSARARRQAGPRRGERVEAGEVVGHVGDEGIRFGLRPSGRRVRPTDPLPMLDSWRLLERSGAFAAGDPGWEGWLCSSLPSPTSSRPSAL